MLTTSPTLLARLREPGQHDAWERFVRLYTPLLLEWSKRQQFQDADAADLTQEVLVKLIHLLPGYERRPGDSFRGWLCRVTTNQCRDFRRRKATRPLPADQGLSADLGERSPPDFEEVEYRRALVGRGLELIRPDFNDATWAAFEAVMVHGRPVPEVADELGLTSNAVYLARHRVLTRLREELDGFLD